MASQPGRLGFLRRWNFFIRIKTWQRQDSMVKCMHNALENLLEKVPL